MAAVSTVMTFTFFHQQEEQAVELLVEKGTTLIRSFEASLRNPLDVKNEMFRLQKLLTETAQQPDIDYIIVTDKEGNIIADGDPAQVGDKYGLDLDIGSLALSHDIRWRQVVNPQGAGTFEVYRGFFPLENYTEEKTSSKEKVKSKEINKLIIYVGLNMATI
jgi:two-component system sensor histidine kinase HydH